MKGLFMKKYIFLILIYIINVFALPATDFDQANLFYEQGEYEKAASSYEKIIYGGYENGEIYYNLGSCYYKTGDIAKCIVNYERALKFMPKDSDLIENLKIARLSLVDKIEEPSEIPLFTIYYDVKSSFNIYTSEKAFYLSIIILGALLSLYILLKNTAGGKFILVLCAAAFLYSAVISYTYYDITADNSKRFGVIDEDKVSVLSSPDENVNSKELFYLHRGTKAEITRSNERWLEISLDEEKKGWVKKESVIEI
jgi:tetratricopeptide (TPR) repeat protein